MKMHFTSAFGSLLISLEVLRGIHVGIALYKFSALPYRPTLQKRKKPVLCWVPHLLKCVKISFDPIVKAYR